MPVLTVESGRFRARDLVMRAFPNQYTGSAAGNLFRQGAVHINGERVTTDLAFDLQLKSGEDLAGGVEQLHRLLQDAGAIFRP